MVSKPPVHHIEFPTVKDERGELTFIEGDSHIPFEIKRVFYIYDVPFFAERGGHAHKTCEQVLIAIRGRVRIWVDGVVVSLHDPNKGLYIPPGYQMTMKEFSANCILLVLASEHFDEEDYANETRPIRKAQPA